VAPLAAAHRIAVSVLPQQCFQYDVVSGTIDWHIDCCLSGMATETRLRHLDAARVDTPVGNLGHISVLSPTEGSLGELEGVIIDPNERHVRYYVVESRGWLKTRRYLVPDAPVRLDPDRKALHLELEADDLSQLPELQDDEFPPFTDDDFVTALFAHR
jgi:hypothetical protein